MTTTFRKKIQQSLNNPALQEALDGNAERRRAARETAYESLPEDWSIMRQHAQRVRAQTIDNLESYLERFVERVRANGTVVHFAADTQQAQEIVIDIARENKARLVAKSKTMVGEEIKINQALEQAGIQVVETDLGEYIVQLRGEPPAHIITPAVHLRRQEVAETFQEKLGVPYDEDIAAMTETARQILREVFLRADIGISGVNFGVVESGSLCVLTNEGNARLVTTLPPVHVALMGIERLVPCMDDLALMLYLLPRSATGQKITVYTSLIHSPKRPGEPDGPRERHLVLVDNNRSALRQSSISDILFCIRCGACINACPVFREIGGHAYVGKNGETTPYPGPIGSVVSPGLFGQAEFGNLARATSLCGACKDACPVDINLPRLLLRVRAGDTSMEAGENGSSSTRDGDRILPSPKTHLPRGLKLGLSLYTWFSTSPARFSNAQRLAAFGSRLLTSDSKWIKLPAFTGWGLSRDFPRPVGKPFRARYTQIAKDVKSEPVAKNLNSSGPHQHPAAPAHQLPAPIPLLLMFEGELTALGGTFTRCAETDLGERILSLLETREITAIQAWNPSKLPPGLIDHIRKRGIQVRQDAEDSLTAGVTGAYAGIAETGTLVIPSGEGQPQTACVLPEMHIAILHRDHIYENLPQVLNLQEVKEASATVLISGPSRTADIEMTLTIGVHGPRELHVLCVE